MLLTDRQICEAVNKGDIVINPFDENKVQPASYDLRVGAQGATTSTKKKVNIEENLKSESERILGFINSGEIKITDEYQYEDFRKQDDRIEINNFDKMFEKPKKKRFLFF